MPVAVVCAPQVESKAYSFDSAQPEMDVDVKVKLLVADRYQRQIVEAELRAALSACATFP